MTQSPYPYPPSYQHPHAWRPPDPAAPARRASVLMWVLGVLAVLLGILMALLPSLLRAAMQTATPAEAEQMRQQLAQAEQAAHGAPLDTVMLVVGTGVIAVGGVMGVLAFFVRRGGLGAAITGGIFTGLVIGWLLLNLLVSLVTNPVQAVAGLCVMFVPLGLLGLQLAWLVQAARNASAVTAARAGSRRQGGYPPGGYPPNAYPPAGYPPAAGQGYPTQPNYPVQPSSADVPPPGSSPAGASPSAPTYGAGYPGAAQPYASTSPQQGLFGPAPFGIPPPPDEAPAGRYGYPTRPASSSSSPDAPASAATVTPPAEKSEG